MLLAHDGEKNGVNAGRHGSTAKGRCGSYAMTLTSAEATLDSLRARGLNVSKSLLRAGEDSSEGTSTVGALNRGVLAAMKDAQFGAEAAARKVTRSHKSLQQPRSMRCFAQSPA